MYIYTYIHISIYIYACGYACTCTITYVDIRSLAHARSRVSRHVTSYGPKNNMHSLQIEYMYACKHTISHNTDRDRKAQQALVSFNTFANCQAAAYTDTATRKIDMHMKSAVLVASAAHSLFTSYTTIELPCRNRARCHAVTGHAAVP